MNHKKREMGFGGHIPEVNSRVKQLGDKSKRGHEHRQKLLEYSRMVTKKENDEIHEKPLPDIDRKQLDGELKQECIRSNMKEVLAKIRFLFVIWNLFF